MKKENLLKERKKERKKEKKKERKKVGKEGGGTRKKGGGLFALF